MGRPKGSKNKPKGPTTVPSQKPAPAPEKAIDVLKRALAEDPSEFMEVMASVGMVASGTARTVEEPKRARTVDIHPEELEVPLPETPVPEPPKGVLFKSPSNGLWQVLVPSETRPNGTIVPPVMATFEKGVVRLTDPEHIKIMRQKIADRRRKGLPPLVVEVSEDIDKQSGGAKGRSVKSKKHDITAGFSEADESFPEAAALRQAVLEQQEA